MMLQFSRLIKTGMIYYLFNILKYRIIFLNTPVRRMRMKEQVCPEQNHMFMAELPKPVSIAQYLKVQPTL